MIAAILLERNLQNVANYLIVSLAVADLMVACLVMPLGAVYEVCVARYTRFVRYKYLSFESDLDVSDSLVSNETALKTVLVGFPRRSALT